MKVIFCGTGGIGLPAMRAIANSKRHQVVCAITQPDRPAGRDLRSRPSPIKVEAQSLGIPVHQPQKIRHSDALTGIPVADVMVVMAYGQILPSAVLSLPLLGCINLHASLLPSHRGAAPIHASILAGDPESGITVIYMDVGLDTGDILLADRLVIGPRETSGGLHDRLSELAAGSVMRALDALEAGCAPRIPQDHSAATYAGKLSKADGRINWALDRLEIDRRIRAMTPWPGAWTRLEPASPVLKIHRAEPAAGNGPAGKVITCGPDGIEVAAGGGSIVVQELQLEGRKRLPAQEFLRGFPIPVGARFDLSFSVVS